MQLSLSHRSWTAIATALVTFSLTYALVEATLATVVGMHAHSVALYGFGLDSFIECMAAGAMLWRLRAEAGGANPAAVAVRERMVRRFIGFTLLALAVYVTAESIIALVDHAAPHETIPGIALAAISVVIKPTLAWAKLRAARELDSAALRSEAKESLVCSYLSFALLSGLAMHAIAGWWWADAVVALLMVPWLVWEGANAARACGGAHV